MKTDDVLAVLGVADAELILAAADAIAAGDGRAALEVSERLARSGRDVTQFARDLLAHLRQLIVIRTLGEAPDSFTVTAAEPERLRAQAEAISELTLGRAVDTISAALAAIREGDEPRMTVELALLRAARPQLDPSREALLERLERLEAAVRWAVGPGIAASGPAPAGGRPGEPRRRRREPRDARRGSTPIPPRGTEPRDDEEDDGTRAAGDGGGRGVGSGEAGRAVAGGDRSGARGRLGAALARARGGAAGGGQRRGGGARGRLSGLGRVQQAQGRGGRGARPLRRGGARRSSASACGRSTCCSTATRPRRRGRGRSSPRTS